MAGASRGETSGAVRGVGEASGACGAMDNAPDYGSGDSRFESWQARICLGNT